MVKHAKAHVRLLGMQNIVVAGHLGLQILVAHRFIQKYLNRLAQDHIAMLMTMLQVLLRALVRIIPSHFVQHQQGNTCHLSKLFRLYENELNNCD